MRSHAPPDSARRPSAGLVAATASAGLAAVALIAILASPWLQAGLRYPWKAAALFGALMVAAWRYAPNHPFPRLGPANHVTLLRAALVALAAGLVGEASTAQAAWAATLATVANLVLDGVDGRLARRSGLSSAFGARADMETDALLVLVLSVLAWQHGKAGPWILAGGLMRYGFGAAGALLPWMRAPLSPTLRGRAVAVTHLVGLAVAMAPFVRPPWSALAAGATLAVLTWSFAVDVGRLFRARR